MICPKCGNTIEPNERFCQECGAANENFSEKNTASKADAVKEEVSPAAVAAEPVSSEKPAPTADSGSTWNYSQDSAYTPAVQATPAVAAKKSHKGLIVLLSIVGVLAVAAVIIALNFDACKGFFVKTFGSDESYFEYVGEKNVGELAKSISKSYDSRISAADKDGMGIKGEVSAEVGDGAIALLNTLGANMGEIDLSWVKDFAFSFDGDYKDSKMAANMALLCNDKDVISLKCFFDMAANNIGLAIPELNEKYFKADLNDYGNSSVNSSAMMSEFLEFMPDGDTLESLINRYSKIVIDEIDNVKSEKGQFAANAIKEDCTVMNLEIDYEDVIDISKSVLEAAKNDKEILEILDDIEDSDLYAEYSNGEDLKAEFSKSIDEGLKGLSDEDIPETGNDARLIVKLYINSSSDIIGAEFPVENGKIIIGRADDGEQFGFEFSVTGMGSDSDVSILGSGKSSDMENGAYSIVVGGMEVVRITTEDFVCNADKEIIKGRIIIEPGSDIANASGSMGNQSLAVFSLLKLKLTLDIDAEKNDSSITAAILSGDEMLIKLNVVTEMQDPEDVVIPADSEVITDRDEWASSINIYDIVDAFRDTTIPSEYIDALESLADSIYDSYDSNDIYDSYDSNGYGY